MSRTLIVITLKKGRRSFVEELILEEMLADDKKTKVIWGDGKPSGDPYHYRPIGPVPISDLDQFNGNHFIYGWLEALAQSDDFPIWTTRREIPIELDALIEVEHKSESRGDNNARR